MLWPRDEFHAAYGQIKHDALQSGGASVLVLVALDVDALCASAILTRLFKADFVSYALLPVRGYEDIVRIRDVRIASAAGRELRSIVMINCGAIVNVSQLLALPPNVKCYIFDSHRPIHLANIYDASQQIVVFDDGAQAIEEFPEDGSDIERDEFEDSDEEDEDEDDEEGESDEDEDQAEEVDEDDGEAEVEFGDTTEPTEDTEEAVANGVPASPGGSADGDAEQKKRKRDEDGEVDGDDDSGEEANDGGGNGEVNGGGDTDVEMVSPKKQKTGVRVEEVQEDPQEDLNAKQAKRKRREQILRYYRGSFHGAPAASIAFELAQQMNAGSNRDLLWFAIVGLTKQFVMEEIDADNYNLMVHRFQDEVLALDATAASGGADDDQTVVNPAYEHGRITFEEEYRFMCYRHWSLYEAMYYSDYVAAKLGLYMDQARRFGARNAASTHGSDGETTLHVFLARMGFSLRQSQQKFTYMPLEMKQQLRDKIQEIAPEFGLDDVFYGSFKRQFAFQYLLGAADAVHGLHALLEAPESYISSVFQAENHNQKGLLQQPINSAFTIDSKDITPIAAKDGDDPVEDQPEDFRDFKHQNFFMASSALSCSSVASSALMESGIKVAMELKQAIIRVGISIMERKLIVRVKHFRYVCLNIPEREQELFANPNVLTQLALFLLTVHRTSGKWGGGSLASKKKKKGDDEEDAGEDESEETAQKPIVPLVLITKNPAQNCFLVVGITCPNNPGEVHRNTLGTAFRLAAGETGANFRQDGFSSAVLEIQMDDIQYFVEQLHNVMDASKYRGLRQIDILNESSSMKRMIIEPYKKRTIALSGDRSRVMENLTATELARELSSRGEIYLALDVLLGSLKAPHDKFSGKCSSRAEWFALVEVLNMAIVRRAAEDAFQLTSFLGRFGLQPHDEVIESLPRKTYSGKNPTSMELAATSPGSPDRIPRLDSLPPLPSECSEQSSTTSGVSLSETSHRRQFLYYRRELFQAKRQEWKRWVKQAFQRVFRAKDKRSNALSSCPDNQVDSTSSEDRTSTRSQLTEQSDRDRYFTPRRFRSPGNEESISRSRSYAFWALSECEVPGTLENSGASGTTSFAMMEDLENSAVSNPVAPAQTKGIVRFFESFRFLSLVAV